MGRKREPVICPYCAQQAECVPDSEVYRRGYGRNVWLCRPCKAWVGCHGVGKVPLGRLANEELRRLKIRAHFLFDQFWQAAINHRGWKKNRARGVAYAWLAAQMGIPKEECHVGMFDPDRCAKAIGILEQHHARIKARANA